MQSVKVHIKNRDDLIKELEWSKVSEISFLSNLKLDLMSFLTMSFLHVKVSHTFKKDCDFKFISNYIYGFYPKSKI